MGLTLNISEESQIQCGTLPCSWVDKAHISGIKVGPTMQPDELVRLLDGELSLGYT